MRPKFSHALANLLMSLWIAVLECVAKAAPSVNSTSLKVSTLVSHIEELSIGVGMEVHAVSGGVKDMRQEDEREDYK